MSFFEVMQDFFYFLLDLVFGHINSEIKAHADGNAFSCRIEHVSFVFIKNQDSCLLYTSDAADDLLCVALGGRRIIKKKNNQ